MTPKPNASSDYRLRRICFCTSMIESTDPPPRPKEEEYESVYCLFDRENFVTMYETRADALSGQREIEAATDTFGPFEIGRHELPLVQSAARAIRLLRALCPTVGGAEQSELNVTLAELERSWKTVFPFSWVRLTDGSRFHIKSGTRNKARK